MVTIVNVISAVPKAAKRAYHATTGGVRKVGTAVKTTYHQHPKAIVLGTVAAVGIVGILAASFYVYDNFFADRKYNNLQQQITQNNNDFSSYKTTNDSRISGVETRLGRAETQAAGISSVADAASKDAKAALDKANDLETRINKTPTPTTPPTTPAAQKSLLEQYSDGYIVPGSLYASMVKRDLGGVASAFGMSTDTAKTLANGIVTLTDPEARKIIVKPNMVIFQEAVPPKNPAVTKEDLYGVTTTGNAAAKQADKYLSALPAPDRALISAAPK